MAAAHVAMLTGARGPVRSCLTACAASTQAIGEAMMLIRRGDADIMISGGAHSMIHPLGMTGFNRLTALSRRSSGQSIKAAVLANGPYQGLQQTIAFDANGDTPRKVFFTEIRDGRYARIA